MKDNDPGEFYRAIKATIQARDARGDTRNLTLFPKLRPWGEK